MNEEQPDHRGTESPNSNDTNRCLGGSAMKRLLTHIGCAVLALEVLVCLASLGMGQGKDRKLGTCGPPPRKNPERQTSAEAMPPLPLPAVPLRRSEPKAEP